MPISNQAFARVEDEFVSLAEIAPALIWVSGIDGLYTYFNSSWLDFTGRTIEQSLGMGWTNAIHPADRRLYWKMHNYSFDARKEFNLQFRLRRNDGQYRWLTEKGVPRYAENGSFSGYSGSCMDIHEIMDLGKIQQGEDPALMDKEQDSESRFRSLVRQAPFAVIVLNGREMTIETINDRMLKMLGKKPDIVGMTFHQALPELEGQLFFALLDNVYTSGQAFYGNEIKAVVDHGGILNEGYYNFTYQPIKDETDTINGIICTAVDVSEQVTARKKAERTDEMLRMAIDAAELGSYYINAADRIFVASPRLKEFFGFGPDEEVSYEAAINQIHPDYRQAAADLVEAAFTTGSRFDMEYPVIGYHDGKIRWVRGLGTVQHDSEGKNSYFTGVLHEITERKQDELRKNDFIGMASHELKTPLTSLSAIVQTLQLQLQDSGDEFAIKALRRAYAQVKRMNAMINGFLNVSYFGAGKIYINATDFDLENLLLETIDEIRLTSPQHTIFVSSCGSILVNADADKICSVIANLLTNAVKYSPTGTVIDVTCIKQGDQVIVSIKDQGIGINPVDLAKIFDRFYRAENSNTQTVTGFGIGLYLSTEIIQRHHGRIWVTSESGKGSTFFFSLPLKKWAIVM